MCIKIADDMAYLIQELKQIIWCECNDREIYRKGIDHSYYYEGYYVYKTREL